MSSNPNVDTPSKKHPPGLYLLFFTEMWERFGFYLLLGILVLYMLDDLKGGLGFDEGKANDIFGTYLALVYLTPFIGGLLADRVFGYRKTIVAGGSLMAAGYLTLAIPGSTTFYVALFLIIIGNGLFKPNISTLLGNLYNKPEYRDLKDKGYNIFYMGINIGAFVCNFIAAWLRNEYGWGYAFAAAGIGMIIGIVIFLTGSHKLDEADQLKPAKAEDMPMGSIVSTIFVPALLFAIVGIFAGRIFQKDNIFGSTSNDAFLFACLPITWFYLSTYLKANAIDKPRVGSLLYIFVVVIIFWAIFHQNGNVLTLWAERNTWRPMPAAVQDLAQATGMVQEVDDIPAEVQTKSTAAGEVHQLKFTNLSRADAEKLAFAMGQQAIVDKADPKAPEIGATFAVTQVLSSRSEGKALAEKLLSEGAIPISENAKLKGEKAKLNYNLYLETLPKPDWPTEQNKKILISTELFQSLNPFFVVILTPVVIGLFGWLASRNLEPSTPAKIAMGLFITGLSTLIMILAVRASHNGEIKVSPLWLVATYGVITVGELCLSPMGLSLVSKLSPGRLTAVMMGGWFLSTSIGNKLAGVLGHLGSDSPNKSLVFYINFAGATLSAFLLLLGVRRISAILRERAKTD